MALAGCAGRPAGSPAAPGQAAGAPASPAPHGATATATARLGPSAARSTVSPRVAAIVTSMTLAQKVGQLLVPTVPGLTAVDGGAELIRRYHVGGVIYFGQNVRDAAQVAALSAGLQQAARSQPPHLPLLIGTDQEGGIVSRLAGVTTVFPGQMAAGATRDPALIRAQDQATGSAMRALGINLDYAPVADVNVDPANPVIGIRSFGADPALVATMTAAAVDGFRQAGEVTVAKHFPGHGDTGVDSHTGLPVIHHTLRQWWAIDAPPFQAAIRAGVDEIMIGHIEVPALDDSGQPASLSRKVVTGLLRDRLGYQGVVVTDSLQMGGVLQGHTPAQIAVQAVQAGCDQLLMPTDPGVAYHAILRAVQRGQITVAQLDAAVARVVNLKVARGLLSEAAVAPSAVAGAENTPPQRDLSQQLANWSITVVANQSQSGDGASGKDRLLPLGSKRVYVAGPAAAGLTAALQPDLAATGGRIVASAADAQVIVAATQNAVSDPAQRQLVRELVATGTPVVVLATGLPYDLGLFRGIRAALASYSSSGVSLNAAAGVLTGRLHPRGRLPVTIPAAHGGTPFRYGTGLGY
ncbi:MAG: glycoside hydrolase family 3 protein [Streptosporangiaceae bacterium]